MVFEIVNWSLLMLKYLGDGRNPFHVKEERLRKQYVSVFYSFSIDPYPFTMIVVNKTKEGEMRNKS